MFRRTSPRFGSHGFTLTEILVTLAIGTTLSAVAAPALVDLAAQREQIERSDLLATDLRVARNQAVFGGTRVGLCRAEKRDDAWQCASTGGDWSGGWLMFVDAATTAGRAGFDPAAGDKLLRVQAALEGGAGLVALADQSNAVFFETDGSVRRADGTPGALRWQLTTTAGARRWICLSPIGRAAVGSPATC
jgi:type IV fimbrial biogenesis protein FimT